MNDKEGGGPRATVVVVDDMTAGVDATGMRYVQRRLADCGIAIFATVVCLDTDVAADVAASSEVDLIVIVGETRDRDALAAIGAHGLGEVIETETDPRSGARALIVQPADRTRPLKILLPAGVDLAELWSQALGTKPLRCLLARTVTHQRRTIRVLAAPADVEQVLQSMRPVWSAEGLLHVCSLPDGLAGTAVEARFTAAGDAQYRQLARALNAAFCERVLSTDGATIERVVSGLLFGRRVAVADAATRGLVARTLASAAHGSMTQLVALGDTWSLAPVGAGREPAETAHCFTPCSERYAVELARRVSGDHTLGIGITTIGPGPGHASRNLFIAVAVAGAEPFRRRLTLSGDPGAWPWQIATAVMQGLCLYLLRQVKDGRSVRRLPDGRPIVEVTDQELQVLERVAIRTDDEISSELGGGVEVDRIVKALCELFGVVTRGDLVRAARCLRAIE